MSPAPSSPEAHETLRVGRLVLTVLLSLLLVGGSVAGALAIARSRPEPPRHTAGLRKVGVRVMEIRDREIRPRIEGMGRAFPAWTVRMASEVGGRVEEVHPAIENGAHISKDDVALSLDPADFQSDVERASALLLGARADLDRLEKQRAFLDRRAEILRAALGIEQSEFERTGSLLERGIKNERDLESARAAVLAREDSLQGVLMSREILEPDILAAGARERERLATLDAARRDLSRATIRIPSDGQILNVAVRRHEIVAPGQRLFDLQCTSRVHVLVALPVSDALLLDEDLRVEPGEERKAAIRTEVQDVDMAWEGSLLRFEPVDGETQTVKAVVEVANVAGRPPLLPGVFCHATFRSPAFHAGLAIPTSALQTLDRIFVVREGRLKVLTPTLGRRVGEWVIVTAGLAPGDQVVVSPLDEPREGMDVEVMATDPTSACDARGDVTVESPGD